MHAQTKYKNGHWVWDDNTNRLLFSSSMYSESVGAGGTIQNAISAATVKTSSGCGHSHLNIKFEDTIEALEQVRFRRYCRRKAKTNEPDVVTIQDIRDVVLFMIPPRQLSAEYIQYFHTPSMDFLLRCLIIYFQFYIQVWEYLVLRREECKTKLHQPDVIRAENAIRDDLADLRSMVSRAYLSLLMGADDSTPYHHIKSNKNKVSQGEKDIRFIEFLYQICTRVVWIALLKRNHNLIEMEIHRIFRSESYNVISHRQRAAKLMTLQNSENRILNGTCSKQEYKLLQRSLVGKEMYLEQHDYRMLSLAIVKFPNMDRRVKYLEIAFSAPEECLLTEGVPVGILGYARSEFDAMLSLRFSRNDDGSIRTFPKMVIPPRIPIDESNLLPTFPNEAPRYTKNIQQIQSTKHQCRLWIKYIQHIGAKVVGT